MISFGADVVCEMSSYGDSACPEQSAALPACPAFTEETVLDKRVSLTEAKSDP